MISVNLAKDRRPESPMSVPTAQQMSALYCQGMNSENIVVTMDLTQNREKFLRLQALLSSAPGHRRGSSEKPSMAASNGCCGGGHSSAGQTTVTVQRPVVQVEWDTNRLHLGMMMERPRFRDARASEQETMYCFEPLCEESPQNLLCIHLRELEAVD